VSNGNGKDLVRFDWHNHMTDYSVSSQSRKDDVIRKLCAMAKDEMTVGKKDYMARKSMPQKTHYRTYSQR
jgi:hypothetical protein